MEKKGGEKKSWEKKIKKVEKKVVLKSQNKLWWLLPLSYSLA